MREADEPSREAGHPTLRLDDRVHHRTRLGVLSVLHAVHKVEFTVLRDTLGLTDGNCNRHLAGLADAGLIELSKSRGPGRARTWAQLAPAGRTALRHEADALHELLDQLDL
jgi:DNA-binding MarR family transcriptional regulator